MFMYIIAEGWPEGETIHDTSSSMWTFLTLLSKNSTPANRMALYTSHDMLLCRLFNPSLPFQSSNTQIVPSRSPQQLRHTLWTIGH